MWIFCRIIIEKDIKVLNVVIFIVNKEDYILGNMIIVYGLSIDKLLVKYYVDY